MGWASVAFGHVPSVWLMTGEGYSLKILSNFWKGTKSQPYFLQRVGSRKCHFSTFFLSVLITMGSQWGCLFFVTNVVIEMSSCLLVYFGLVFS